MSRDPVSEWVLRDPFSTPDAGYCELLLVRHGEQHIWPTGHPDRDDPALSPVGEAQAAALAQRIGTLHVDALLTSPLRRARQTADAVAHETNLTLAIEPQLYEVVLWVPTDDDDDRPEASPEEWTEILADFEDRHVWDAFPHGEGSSAFRKRVTTAVAEIAARHVGERVVVTCHGGVIGVLLHDALASPLDNGIALHHTSISTLRAVDDRRIVIGVNDIAHVTHIAPTARQ